MDYFNFFQNVLQTEAKQCNLNMKKIVAYNTKLSGTDVVFESPYNRCAYMYKYATVIFNFIKTLITDFLNEYSELENLLLMWKSCSDLKLCSLNSGPGLDYLAFTMALSEFVKPDLQPIFKDVSIVSKSAQWKLTLKIIVESVKVGYLKDFPISKLCEKFSVIQDPFKKFSEQQKAAIKNANVILMVRTLNLQSPDVVEDKTTYFKELVDTMNMDSIIFCIDTKPSVSLMTQILYYIPGEYMYGPISKAFRLNENFPEIYKVIYGCLPIISARGSFFVWKKLTKDSCVENLYPSVLHENLIVNTETEIRVENTSAVHEINIPALETSFVDNTNILPIMFNNSKQDMQNTFQEMKVEKDLDLLKHHNGNLKNSDNSSTNLEIFIDENHLSNENSNNELAFLLDQYYNLNKNPSIYSVQSESFCQDSACGINSKILSKNTNIECDVSILLSDVCDVVSHVSSTITPDNFAMKNEKRNCEISNHVDFCEINLRDVSCKNDKIDDKLNIIQNITHMSYLNKLTEPVKKDCETNFGSFSDVSQLSYADEKTIAVKKKKQKAKKLQNLTLVSNVPESSTNSSTNSAVTKNKSDQIKDIKLISSNGCDVSKNLISNEKIPLGIKNPNFKLNMGSVNIIPNQSISKKSVQCGTDSIPKNSNSASIESLTKRINELATSIELILTQNQQLKSPREKICCERPNCTSNPRYNSPSPNTDSTVNITSDSETRFQSLNSALPVKNSTDEISFKVNDNNQKINSGNPQNVCDHKVCKELPCHSGVVHQRQHCADMNSRLQMCTSHVHEYPCCRPACHLHCCYHCFGQSFIHCNHSLNMHGCQSHSNLNVPNIVIPLQNISDNAIAQIISALKDKS